MSSENEKVPCGIFVFPSNTHTWVHIQLCLVISQGPRSQALEEMNAGIEKNQLWLRKMKRKAFYTAVAGEDFREGAESLLKVSVVTIYKTSLQLKREQKQTN